jgi:hypothetical protein
MTDPPSPAAATYVGGQPPAGAKPVDPAALRLARTPWDMTKAVLILLVPVLVAVAVYVFFFGGSNPIAISTTDTYATAAADAHFTVLEPADLPKGWTPITIAYEPGNGTSLLRVGFVSPGGAGVQLIESDQPADTLLADELGATPPTASSVQLGDLTWGQIATAKRGDRALVSTDHGRTVIVTGQASEADLETFVSHLRPLPGPTR